MREDDRKFDELRKVKIIRNYLLYPEGSVLISFGDTKVICTASVEEKVPPFLKGSGTGWVTAEYAMLPRATQTRTQRSGIKGTISGRTQEIQRLIGRSLRSIVDFKELGERTILIDCDVIQADGGTRTASITGAMVALSDAVKKLEKDGLIKNKNKVIKEFVAAVSLGIVNGHMMLDLSYIEDSNAFVDMNLVMTSSGKIVEIQGTAEKETFDQKQLSKMIKLGHKGIKKLFRIQKAT